jgi:replicative DNA helicase
MGQNAAIGSGFPVIVFSLEMSSPQLAERMLCSEARIDSSLLRRMQLQRQDMTNLTVAADNISRAPIMIDDTPAPTVSELRSRCRRWRANKELFKDRSTGLIIIDYLQLMRGQSSGNRNSNREQEISEISRGLKGLAKELGVPIVALSQLNRSLESRQDKRPILSDLRESGAIEQDADVIMFVYRDEYYNKEKCEKPGVAEVIIGKQRNGPIGTAELSFVGRYTRFENLSKRGDEY